MSTEHSRVADALNHLKITDEALASFRETGEDDLMQCCTCQTIFATWEHDGNSCPHCESGDLGGVNLLSRKS